jgi:AhpD family alkylhydroperoxidase
MFESIEGTKEARRSFNLRMLRSGVSTFRDFEELEVDAFRDGALDQKSKELTALGISICHAWYGCMEYHVSRASGLGASRKEILEATAVALALGGGVVQWPARFVFKVLDDLDGRKAADKGVADT